MILDKDILSQVKEHFALLKREVVLTLHTDSSEVSQNLHALAASLVSCSEMLSLEISKESVSAPSPSMSLAVRGEGPRVFFSGLPSGHEFTSLILAILHVGGHSTKFKESTLSALGNLGHIALETVYSNECLNCPDVVQAANALAAKLPNLTHVAIEGSSFQALVKERGVLSVPTVFANGEVLHQGRITQEGLAELIFKKFSTGDVKLDTSSLKTYEDLFDLVVVGAGPAGVSASLYAARKGLRTAIVAERIGGQVLDTAQIDNLISIKSIQGPQLASTFSYQLESHKVEILSPARVENLLSNDNQHEIQLSDGRKVRSRSVILAPGASWRTLGVPGEESYKNKGVTFCPHCDGPLFAGKNVAVIGGGNSGVEAALDLANITSHVYLVELSDQLRADAVLIEALKRRSNVSVLTSTEVVEIIGDGASVSSLKINTNNEASALDVSGVFVQIGLVPSTKWLPKTIELTQRGEIVVDERGRTSVAGVFAAGDATNSPYKQIVSAFGSGSNAAIAAFENLTLSV